MNIKLIYQGVVKTYSKVVVCIKSYLQNYGKIIVPAHNTARHSARVPVLLVHTHWESGWPRSEGNNRHRLTCRPRRPALSAVRGLAHMWLTVEEVDSGVDMSSKGRVGRVMWCVLYNMILCCNLYNCTIYIFCSFQI